MKLNYDYQLSLYTSQKLQNDLRYNLTNIKTPVKYESSQFLQKCMN